MTHCVTIPQNVDCPVYAIIPPKHGAANSSEYIANIWLKSARKKLPDCHRFTNQHRLDDLYKQMAISPLEPPKIQAITPGMGENFFNTLGVTHLIFLDYKLNSAQTNIRIVPAIYRISDHKKIKNSPLLHAQSFETKPSRFEKANSYATTNKILRLMPNSLAFGYSGFTVMNRRFTEENKWNSESYKSNSVVPKLVSSFALTNASHPSLYRSVDYDLSVFFSFVLFNADETFTYRNYDKNDPTLITEETKYTLKLFGGGPLALVNASMYLFKLRLFIEGGFGGGYARASDDLGNKYARFIGLANVGFGFDWFVFGSKTVFMRMAFIGTGIYPDLIKNDIFVSQAGFSYLIGLGYYFGTFSL